MSDNSKKDQAVASQENDNTAKQENDQKDTKDQSLEEKLKEFQVIVVKKKQLIILIQLICPLSVIISKDSIEILIL